MDKIKINPLATYAIIGGILLVFGFYSTTIMYADAVSVSTVTFLAGTVNKDVAYDKTTIGGTATTAYIIGDNGGQSYVFKKSPISDSITGNVTLTGSSSSLAIEFNPDNDSVYAVTTSKFYRITDALGIVLEVASGTAPFVRALIYDDTDNILYYCTTTGFGTVNINTLALTSLFTVAGVNPVLDCALDTVNGFMYLSGGNMVTTLNLIKVSLDTLTIVNSVDIATSFGGVCHDDIQDVVWVADSSNARVIKYTNTLTQITTVTTGATPRYCSISTDETARRLYTTNDGTNTVSIIDIDGNAVLFSPATCDSTTLHRMDTIRLENTTNTYITCVSNTNSIVIDDTVSSFTPTDPTSEFCEIPANFNLLTCVLERGDTTPITGASELVNQSSTNIVCQIGLISCTQDEDGNFTPDNPDIQTNGVGYLLLAISLGIMVGVLWVASDGQLTNIPTFIWFIATLAIVGTLTAFDWIDPTFLVISIIVIIAMATAKAKGVFSDSQLFKGESI